MKILITGGAGFIGCNTARHLIGLGHDVIVFDNLETGRLGNLHDIKNEIKFVKGDIRRKEELDRELKGVEAIIHLAAYRAVVRSMDNPAEVTENNVMGTLNVLMAAREAGVRRVVFASSSSVYGMNENPLQKEEHYPMPMSPYAASKMSGEHFMHVYARSFGVETVSLRYFNVFGPWQHPESKYAAVIPIFVKKLLAHESPIINGDGEQSRDFTYVKNVVEANILSLNAPNASGKFYNIGAGDTTSVNTLFELIRGSLGGCNEIEPEYGPAQPGDVKRTHADIQCAKKDLGYIPRYALKEGLSETLKWYLETGVASVAH